MSSKLIYTGAMSVALRRLKFLSLASTSTAIVAAPLLTIAGNEGVPVPGKIAMAGAMCLVSVSTTALLHWFTNPYVRSMMFDPKTHSVTVETLSLTGKWKPSTFNVEDIVVPKTARPFVTFAAAGRDYFVMKDDIAPGPVKRAIAGDWDDVDEAQDTEEDHHREKKE